MSGEGHSVFFRRTNKTEVSNKSLCRLFENLIMDSPVTTHMKFYPDHVGQVQLYEKGGADVPSWMEHELRFDGTFYLYISTTEDWYDNADIYESYEREDSFVSIAKKFANNYGLEFYNGGVFELEEKENKNKAMQ